MIRYTKRYVNIISLIITTLIFISLYKVTPILNTKNFFNIFKKDLVLVELSASDINQETKDNNLLLNNVKNLNTIDNSEEKEIKNTNWKISIPKISLDAEISEGTSKSIMDKFVGHFEDTAKTSGNVGLAAHNRGYPVNYFANIKKLVEGDKIIYTYHEFTKTYVVIDNKIITDIDWEPLENTNENVLTLITCVENEPEYRRCVQAIEK